MSDPTRTWASLDRRTFLRAWGAAAALGLLPAGCGGVPATLLPAPGEPLQVLGPREYAVFVAATRRIVGPRLAERIDAGAIDPGRAADRWVSRVPAIAGAFRQGLWLLEFGIPPVLAKLRPFTSLDSAGQDSILDELMHSRFDLKRQLFKGLKSLACLTVYSSPVAREVTRFPGPFDAEGIARAMNYETEPR